MAARALQDHLFAQLAAVERDKVARTGAGTAKLRSLRARLFAQQRALIEDPCRRKVLLCGRRAGKTYAMAAALIDRCLRVPGSNCLYGTLTREHAFRLLWDSPKTGLKTLDRQLELSLDFNNTHLTARFPNGSQVRLTGFEHADDLDKHRGEPYDLVAIDEAKSFSARVLDELLDEVLGAALDENMGTVLLGGTPGPVLAGPFYEASRVLCTPNSPGRDASGAALTRPYALRKHADWQAVARWSGHRWSARDNKARPGLWAAFLETKRAKGWSDDNPIWRREYLGEWVADDSALVYRYDDERNGWDRPEGTETPHGLPEGHEWRTGLSLDPGYEDATAISVCAWSPTSRDMYVLAAEKWRHLTLAQIARNVKDYERRYSPEVVVADPGGGGLTKLVLQTLIEEHGIDLVPADKKGEKRDPITVFNSDLLEGRIRFDRERAAPVIEEMRYLCWDERGKREEEGMPNDAADSVLYLHRWSQHRMGRAPGASPAAGSDEAVAAEQRAALEHARKKRKAAKELDGWDGEVAQVVFDDGDDLGGWGAWDAD